MAKNSVETAIRNAASSKVAGKYNLPQYKKEGTAHYDERQKARLWLTKIAYNTFLNHHAKTVRHRFEDIDATAMISSQYSSDESFRYQELLQAMAQLPDSERTTLILHYFEGYKVEEIAHITNCTDAAVKKRLQRGREELKRRIKL